MNKRTVYVLGSPVEPLDSAAILLAPKLQKKFPQIDFVHLDPTEEFPRQNEEQLIIIDTVIGIKKVSKFDDINNWVLSPRATVHDFDLPLSLGILKKLGKINKVMIIGIPTEGKPEKIINDITEILISSGI